MLPIILALVFIAILLFVIVAGQPDDFKVTRSATISARPDGVFPQVNELKKWEAWSPWAKLDPNAKSTFEGPAAGAGAAMLWSGNNKVGQGKMTITESEPSHLIRLRLEFLRPFKATNTAEFRFAPEGGRTLVSWSMLGRNNLMSKVFSLLMDCDKMVGRDFEKGLASLKGVAESGVPK